MAKRKLLKNTYLKDKTGKFQVLFNFSFFILLSAATLFLAVFIFYARDLPRPEKFTERQLAQSTKIYDRTGTILLYEIYGEEKRETVLLGEISPFLKNAVIATEDAAFYSHHGINIKGIIRSFFYNIKTGTKSQGGSTIPQQLIRSTFLTNEKTIERKVREIILSLELSRRYSKEQILEWYLNQIPFGSNAYGAETASKIFFGKTSKDLSLAEAAALTAMIRGPSLLSPYGENKNLLLERKDYVLDRMVELNFIAKEKAEEAKKEEIVFIEKQQVMKAPHFVIEVQKYLEGKYGKEYLKTKGLKVYTSLDWQLQNKAEEIVKEETKNNEKYGAYNSALVAINPNNGDVLAVVGSKDSSAKSYPEGCIPRKSCLFEPDFNVAFMGLRQPGSSFKPIVYATAFKKGYDDKTIVVDELTDFGIWGGKHYIPKNYDGRFRGPVSLRQALAQSLNIPAVKVLVNLAGIEESLKQAKEMGITTLTQPLSYYGPSLVLGSGEIKLLELTSAYGIFATGGLKVSPVIILKIEDNKGSVIEERNISQKRVLESNVAQLITSILSDNEARTPIFGARSLLYFPNYKVAAKTGTTQDYRDGWTIGYTPDIAVGVWAGNNDNSSARRDGASVAGPIWHKFLESFLSGDYKKETE